MSDNIHAVLVGVEAYSDGNSRDPRWDLNGPAGDVERMAVWLKSIGVPESHLHLHVSPLDQGQFDQALHGHGLYPCLKGDASIDAVCKTIEHDLDKSILADDKRDAGTNVLLIYWSGHGAIKDYGRDIEKRVVFTADQRKKKRSLISVTDLANSLGSSFGDFRVVTIVDACALDLARMNIERSVVLHNFAGGDYRPEACEPSYQFFSAARGQLALNRGLSAAGLFSEHLLAAFSTMDNRRGDFCRNLDEAVSAAQLKVTEATQGTQKVVVQSLKNWDMEKPMETGGQAAQPSRIGKSATYLCDRTDQWRAVRTLAKKHFASGPTRPLFVLAHGAAAEFPLSLLHRLAWELRYEQEVLNRSAAGIEFAQLATSLGNRPDKDEIHMMLRKAMRMHFSLESGTDQDIANHIEATRQCHICLAIVQSPFVRSNAGDFIAAIESYAEQFPVIDAPAAAIVLVFVSYPGKSLQLADRGLRKVLIGRGDGATCRPNEIACITQLASINLTHLDQWATFAEANFGLRPIAPGVLLNAVLRGKRVRTMGEVVIDLQSLV